MLHEWWAGLIAFLAIGALVCAVDNGDSAAPGGVLAIGGFLAGMWFFPLEFTAAWIVNGVIGIVAAFLAAGAASSVFD